LVINAVARVKFCCSHLYNGNTRDSTLRLS
jgi:hypothetical protein